MSLRFIVHHLHPTSARLRFLKSPGGFVVFPTPLPRLSDLLDACTESSSLLQHPSTYLKQLSETLQINPSTLQFVKDFRCWVDTPKQTLVVYLVRVVIEQPFTPQPGYQWIELPDSFSLIAIERLMLQRVYEFHLGHD